MKDVVRVGDVVSESGVTLSAAPSAGGSAHVIKDETVSLTARTNLNFTGAGVEATDNAGTDSTDVTIAGGSAFVSDTAYASSWNAVTTIAPSKNAVYDKIEAMQAEAILASQVFGW